MPEEQQLKRAQVLFGQKRFADAEQEFGRLLILEPNKSYYHSMLALCFLYQLKYEKAEEHAKNAISNEPSSPFPYYVSSLVFFNQNKIDESKSMIDKSIELDPFDADYFSVLSSIYLAKKEWTLALEKANEGLSIDAEHIDCLNARAKAYIKLDNKNAAYETINEALYFDPQNAYTHANLGWGLIEKGDYKKALIHFKQSLSIDPTNNYAKAGLVEALKARYFFYRIFLRYAFWLGNMKSQAQWGILIGLYVGSQALRAIGRYYPQMEVITMPLIFLYVVFAITTWIITPLSNLFLRLNKYGKHALTEDAIQCSNYVGISFLISFVSFLSYLLFQKDFLVLLAITGFSMAIPISGTYNAEPGSKGRKALKYYAIVLVCISALGIALNIAGDEMLNKAFMLYFIGIILYQWIANTIVIRSN
jgi:tetratricopeptide (TPR) repeat protein